MRGGVADEDRMSFLEATHPRCGVEGCPDRPGRASRKEGESWCDHSEVFVGIDTSKLRNAVAIAEAGRAGEVRYLGEIDTRARPRREAGAGLASKYRKLTFCYEAGPCGYGLQRQIESLGHDCMVVAPSLIPKKPGDRVKTDRRDALRRWPSCCGRAS